MAQQIDIVANLLMKVDGAEAGINKLKSSLSKLKMPEGLENSFKKSFANLDTIFAKYRSQIEKGFDTKGDVSAFTKTSKQLDAELNRLSKHFTELTGKPIDFKIKSENLINAEKELARLVEQKNKLTTDTKGIQLKFEGKEAVRDVETLMKTIEKAAGNTKAGNFIGGALIDLDNGNISQTITQLEQAAVAAQKLGDKKKVAFESENGTSMVAAIQKIVEELRKAEGEFSKTDTAIDGVKSDIDSIQAERMQKVGQYAEDAANGFEKERSALSQLNGEAQEYARSVQSMSQQLGDLQQSTQYFFSLRNMLNLLKRGIDQAIDTVKELDAAMTETAVVTDFSVGDMWEKLPEYTANANALGASVKDMYKATTLYYQQGLDTDAAMGIANETMKMARIGGLEAADATDKMTAALRGFNMELNETSAQRVNDVYSNLAAKTASNTEELGTAMQRTASIAASAGMSFEGTAAFLAQAIETTREPAENLGTAMKTIVARFTELKKNPLEISEVDGEEVDYNKVDTALKSIGVSLKDANGQFRNLDQVFLDISQRWDSLSQTQQRYVATQAAGSRQQSRFIAMMSNYERTVQLMDYANNSAGASNEQFGKTMESLEAKLNKLKNAWDQFLMGIANSSFIKTAVDGLTDVLGVINKLINTFSLGSGALKSGLSIFAAFNGLKATGRIANSIIGGIGGMLDPTSTFSAGFSKGMIGSRGEGNAKLASQIYTPIVAAIRELKNAEQQKNNQPNRDNPYDSYNRFKDARANLFGLGAKGNVYNLKDVQGQLGNLDSNSQNILMRGVAGTTYNLRKAVLDTYYKQLFGNSSAKSSIKEAERYLNNQRQLGQLTWKEYFDHISDPNLMRKALNSNHAGAQAADELLQKMSGEIQQKADVYAKEETNRLYEQFAEQGYEIDTPEIQEVIKKAQEQARKRATDEHLESIQGKNGNIAALFNTVGKLGTGFSQAGMGLQTFGNILSSSANPAIATFGAALSSIGGIIGGLGTGISGLVNGFTTIASSRAMEGLSTALTGTAAAAGTLTGVIGIVIAALGSLAFILKKRSDHIKKAGENIRNDYTTKKSEVESNISNLESLRAEFALLSKGVDRFGNNVTLDTSDYARYKEIVAQIAEINPSIVEGFNAQGDAIINNNQALEETLALQKQIQKQNVQKYSSTASLQTLINARNEEDAFKLVGGWVAPGGMKRDVAANKYLQTLQKNLNSSVLEQLGIDTSKTGAEQVDFIANNIDSIQKITDAYVNAGRISDKQAAKILDRATEFQQALADVETASLPVYESLSEYATLNKLMSNVPEEMYGAYQAGLKNIAAKPINADEMHRQAKDLANTYTDIFDDPRYKKAVEGIEKATTDYSDSLDEMAYKTAINGEDVKGNLESYIAELQESGDEASLIAAQHLQTILAKAQDMQEIAGSLGEAFDTMAKHISQLKEAANNFSEKAEEIDPQSGAKAIKGIYDTIFGENSTHALGEGDAVYWFGAQAVINDEVFRKGNKEQIDAIYKKLAPTLEEGIDGIIATEDFFRNNPYKDLITANPEGGITSNIHTEEEMAQAAKYYGVTTDVLAALLKRLDQFGLDFVDYNNLRTNYAASEQKIVGDKTTEIEGQVGVLVDEQQVLNDAIANGQSPQDFYKEGGIKDTLQKEQNVDMLPKFIEGSSKEAKENHKQLQTLFDKYNINDQNYVEQLKLLGRTQDEIETIASSGLIEGANKEEVAERFENAPGAEDDKYASDTVNKLGELVSLVSSIADHFGLDTDTTGITTGEATKADFLSNNFETAASGAIQNYLSGKNLKGETFLNSYDKKQTEKEIKDNLIAPLNAYKEQLEKGKKEAEANAKAHPGDENAQLKVDNYNSELGKVTSMLSALQSIINPSMPLFNNAGMEAYYGTNIGKTLSTVDPSVIAENQEAFSNIFNDIVTGALPSEADLQSLGILEAYKLAGGKILEEAEKGVEDSAAQKTSDTSEQQIRAGLADAMSPDSLPVPTGRNAYGIHEKIQTFFTNLYSDFAEADKAALVMDAMPSSDNISNAIQNVGQKLKNWYDKIRGIDQANQEQPSNTTPRSIPTPTTPQPQIAEQSQEQNIVFHADTGELDSAKDTIQNLFNLTNQPVSFIVNTALQGSTSDILAEINEVREATKKKNTIKVGTKITGQEGIKNLSTIINQVKPKTVKISASVSGANLVSSLASKISALKDKVVNITTKHKSVGSDGGGGASGINNHIPATRVPSFGSLAKGTKSSHGQVGPRNRGGLTLTGEKGFEIAWLPSENRSMILGAEGPQMLNLPSDAVVYTHEQSKKIIKQKGIPAGSHADVATGSTNVRAALGGSTGSSAGKKIVDNAKKTGDKISKTAEDTSKAVGRVLVWWDNAARRADAIQRKTDKNQKAYEKYLKEMQATLKTTGTIGKGNDFIANTQKAITEYQRQFNKATAELNALDTGSAAKSNKGRKNQYAAGADNIVEVSYKKGKKTKTAYMNTASYIRYDSASGSYQIDEAALKSIKNVDQRKAFYEAAKKELNDRISKKNAAEDAIEKAQEALEKFGEELYNTFFKWENELTRIWNLTKKIEATENNISRIKSYEETLNKQISTGLAKSNDTNRVAQTMDVFRHGLAESTDKIRTQVNLIDEQKKALQKALSVEDERTTLASIQAKLNQRYALDSITNQASNTLSTARANLSSAQQRAANKQSQIASLKAQKKKAKKTSKKNKIQKQINAAQNELNNINSTINYYAQQVNNATAAYNQAVANASNYLNDTEKLGYEEYAKNLQEQIEAQTAAQKYLSVRAKGDGTVEVTFDTEAFEADKLQGLFTEERGKAIQDYVKKIEETSGELSDAYKNANDSVNELYDQLEQLENDWAEYANELWDIHDKEVKTQTDNFKKLSDSINKALKELLDEVKRKLDDRRKQEDNANTERDISQKQQRLAALRADTAGGHQVEIAQLEKEIAEAQQNYQRSLEDQLLDKLQQQADLASQQRERQIELQEAIADGVNNAAMVDLWMSNPDAYRDEIYEAFKLANDYDKKPQALQDQLERKFNDLMIGLTTNQKKQEDVVTAIGDIQDVIDKIAESLMLMTTDITNAKSNGLSVTQAQDLLGASYSDLRTQGGYDIEDFAKSEVSYEQARQAFSAEELKGNKYYAEDAQNEIVGIAKSNLDKAWNAYYYSNKNTVDAFTQARIKAEELGVDTSGYDVEAKIQQQKDAEEMERRRQAEADTATRQANANAYNNAIAAAHKKKSVTKDSLRDAIAKGAAYGVGKTAYQVAYDLAVGDGKKGVTWKEVMTQLKALGYSGKTVKSWNSGAKSDSAFYKAFVSIYGKWSKFATGGLASYTGPAWLDGTPSKPELVLNAADTKNFLALRDVLSSAMKSTSAVTNSYGGDIMYDINIHVDKIEKDYDVDRVVDKVKKEITKGAGYRNVTQVRNFK